MYFLLILLSLYCLLTSVVLYVIFLNLKNMSIYMKNMESHVYSIREWTSIFYKTSGKLFDLNNRIYGKIKHHHEDSRKIYTHLICNSRRTRYYHEIKRHSFG